MNICLSCLKPLDGANTRYHMPCLQKLFAMRTLPSFDFGVSDILSEIIKIDGRMSISGVQPKISLRLNREKNVLEIIAENGEYILKPQTQSIKNLPENEQLCMTLADIAGFSSPPHALIRLKDNTFAYIVKRFDRKDGAKIHQEDFQQILALNINDKYQGSYEKIGKAIKNISTVPGLDLQFFYERILFYFMIGNGDAHAKNFSMQYFDDGQRRLSPVYDIVSSRLAIPEEKEETALALNGKRNNITLSDFSSLSQYLNILQVAKINNTLLDMKDDFINTINAYKLFSFEIRKRFKEVIRSRISALNKQI